MEIKEQFADVHFYLVENEKSEIVKKRLKKLNVYCPICELNAKIKATTNSKNEYILDCGHYIGVGGHYIVENDEDY